MHKNAIVQCKLELTHISDVSCLSCGMRLQDKCIHEWPTVMLHWPLLTGEPMLAAT